MIIITFMDTVIIIAIEIMITGETMIIGEIMIMMTGVVLVTEEDTTTEILNENFIIFL